MTRISCVPAILLLIVTVAPAQTTTLVPDKAHSGVNFSILHMSLSNVRGHFGNIGGTITLNDSDMPKSSVNVTIDMSTVDTGVPSRDADLKSANFFDVAQYPTATFASTSVARENGGLTVNGNLTLHGVTKPVTLHAEGPNGPVNGMDHKPHYGFSATTTISRTAFGIATKYPSAVVGDEVKLTIDLDAAKQ
ncbi:MAG TPA: YceI family protein [Acidobacteriaceae bacterium]|nr:YceI family protein [Acidobacteriaceae bacterium]